MIEVILKTSRNTHNATRITGLIFIVIGLVIQFSPFKEKKSDRIENTNIINENYIDQSVQREERNNPSENENSKVEIMDDISKNERSTIEQRNISPSQIEAPNSLEECFKLLTITSIQENSKNNLKNSILSRFKDSNVEVVKYNNNIPTPDGTTIEDYIEAVINSGKKIIIRSDSEKSEGKITKLHIEEI
jgi:hypothetical protein